MIYTSFSETRQNKQLNSDRQLLRNQTGKKIRARVKSYSETQSIKQRTWRLSHLYGTTLRLSQITFAGLYNITL